MTDFSPNAPPGKADVSPRVARILHITDFHFLAEAGQKMLGVDTERSFADVLKATLDSGPQPDLALLTGDLVQDPVESAYRRLRNQLSALPYPAYCLPGNHDDPELISEILAGGNVFFQPRILLDHWQIICLDSTIPRRPHGRLAESQFGLMETLLAERPDRHALIALHHHPAPSGSAWMDTMLLENNGRFFGLLEKYSQVKGVLYGHVHQAVDRIHGGLRLLATPSTCFQFKPLSIDFGLDAVPPGYRWIELQPDGAIDTILERLREVPDGLDFTSEGY